MYQVYQKPLRGESVGVVFGTFAPLHQGHLDIIMRAKKENDGGVLVICCGNETDDKGCQVGLPISKRYRYVREFFKDDDLVSVHAIEDIGAVTYSFDNWLSWLDRFEEIWNDAVNEEYVDQVERVWYVGEQIYHDDLVRIDKEYERYFNIGKVILVNRSDNPISGTMIRNNPIKYWNKIALPFRREFSHNILVIGTASEGKSTLVQDLAKYFGTSHAHEWPRDYISEHCLADWEFDANTFLTFLVGQREHMEKQKASPENNGVFFCDTDALITAMYAQKYASEKECALAPYEWDTVIHPVARHIALSTKWNKVYFLTPGNNFVDDHSRFMKHAELTEREDMELWLISAVIRLMPDTDIEYLPGGDYLGNFETIKNYVKEIYNNAYVD